LFQPISMMIILPILTPLKRTESQPGILFNLFIRCDRILWEKNPTRVKLRSYTRGETLFSDHRPVRSRFFIEVRKVHTEKKVELEKKVYEEFV
jgi:alpha-amylase/alpha-mannosidase (GH57 family)